MATREQVSREYIDLVNVPVPQQFLCPGNVSSSESPFGDNRDFDGPLFTSNWMRESRENQNFNPGEYCKWLQSQGIGTDDERSNLFRRIAGRAPSQGEI